MGETDQSSPTSDSTDAPSVSALNEQIKQHFKEIETFCPIQCHGEVTNVNRYDYGVRFILIDESCEINCMCWSDDHETLDFTISDGMEVVLDGVIGYYPAWGSLRLYVNDATLVGTGTQTTATEQLEADLDERGWFDETTKSSLPQVPERIGVVTSHNGDAGHDIITAIPDSAPVDIVHQHATVQGTNAPQSIVDGIQQLEHDEDVDVMIVGRGGGSTTDLQAFNSKPVAEAIHRATTPIVTAVGHTSDQLIADRVADGAVTTPREAGKTVISNRGELWGRLKQLENDLDTAYEQLQREHDHKQQLDQAVANAQATNGHRTTLYKAAIAGLIAVVIVLTGILLL